VGKPEGKRPFCRYRCRWEEKIEMNLQKVGCGSMGRIDLVQDRDRLRALLNTVMNLRVQYNAGNFLTNFLEKLFGKRKKLDSSECNVPKSFALSYVRQHCHRCLGLNELPSGIQSQRKTRNILT
jgi:hypothetical protein